METKVPYLNITDKQYIMIGVVWGLIFAAMYHFYANFELSLYSIVLTFFSMSFLFHALIGVAIGFILSYFGLRYLNR